ncbi:MAG TPA: ATP-binding protein [Dehalococcoidia bacterium]|nr:ATP-binding protein [Dehalococcoidia bacterium]
MPATDPQRRARMDVIRNRDADRLQAALGRLPRRRQKPALIILIGFPGSGKSHLARSLKARYPAAILDSDALRQVLFATPEHTTKEHGRLFPAIHVLMRRLLEQGISVIVDATNLKEANRRPYYAIAQDAGLPVVLVRVVAPVSEIRRRLARRKTGRNADDHSTATMSVFESMKGDYERPRRRYFTVNTARNTDEVLDKIVARLQS